jgi:dTDP-4-dehydrorhamnose 3,5-epimerase
MRVDSLAIPAVKLIHPIRHADDRGFFSETWKRARLLEEGLDLDFQQENHSLSREAGVVRGLHFQTHPAAQAKLLRVVRGRIWDVAVDLRRRSPTYGKWVAAELSAENWTQILVPVGFAHGFCTLEPDTEVVYLVSSPYSGPNDAGVAWDDPDLAVDWPIDRSQAILSDKDRRQPAFRDIGAPFE